MPSQLVGGQPPQDTVCWNPFEELRCGPTVYTTCCPVWLDTSAWIGSWGNYTNEIDIATPWQIWNSETFQSLRRAVLERNFQKFCHKCSKLGVNHLEGPPEAWMQPVLAVPPRRIWLEHDRQCNLKCAICRPEKVQRETHQDKRDAKIFEICEEFLPTATRLVTMTAGEPFASPSTLRILATTTKYPNLEIHLYTNGLLLPDKWHLLPEERIVKLDISIDAATQSTYEILRYPGKWEKITRSLQFIKEKRDKGLIPDFQLIFVVQAQNYHEIPQFIQMCIELKTKCCVLNAVMQYHHSNEEFARMNVCDERHPQHRDFLSVLSHPILQHPIVWCPSLWRFMPNALLSSI